MWVAVILVAVSSCLIYFLAKKKYSKSIWEKYGVTQVPGGSIMDQISVFAGTKTIMDMDNKKYNLLEKISEKYAGFYDLVGPCILVKDLEILKKVLIKDFDYFIDRRPFFSGAREPLITKMLFSLFGEEWKGVRTSLTPTFTTGKIRRMMENFNQVGNAWVKNFDKQIGGGTSTNVNIQTETIHYTVDIIAASVFGMNAGTIHDRNSIFSKMSLQVAELSTWRIVKFGLSINLPWLVELLNLEIIDQQGLEFFRKVMVQGLNSRMSGEVKRNDFMQLIAEARKGELKGDDNEDLNQFEKDAQISGGAGMKKNYLNDDTMAQAQLIGFFFAGFNTTSNVIAWAAYVLAVHQDVQEKLREELDTKLFKDGDHNMDYDVLNRLVYMDMFLSEVLRKYPPLGRLERKCVKDYHDPESGLRIPKDATVIIPVDGIHNDTQYYEHPDKFYPEHFTPEKKAERNPYTYLPFGVGPRNCIGMRFALVETKSAIAHLVHNFKIEPTKNTPIPIKQRPVGLGVQIPDNLELKLTRRNK
ncbi:unnamed protein product [Orchesella dallaii]|uniref:Cytochrome P450 9e2 n=1 Tax=Orchesella dallaii TaxID=48710 RepID=A0ABP1S797_9HEXA